MIRYRLAEAARADLLAIATQVALMNEAAADRLIDKLFESFEMLRVTLMQDTSDQSSGEGRFYAGW